MDSKDVIGIFGILISMIIWTANEYLKRKESKRKITEERYLNLIGSIRGFMRRDEDDLKKIDEFYNQVNLSYIYCSDKVINECYDFIDTMYFNPDNPPAQTNHERVIGNLLLTMRRDLGVKTSLSETKYREVHFSPNKE